MAINWQQFFLLAGARRDQVIMVVAPGSRYGLAIPPDVVLQPRNGVVVQIAPETRVPVEWRSDERGVWAPVERGHSRTRAIAQRHHTGERPDSSGTITPFGGVRGPDRRTAVANEVTSERRSAGIFRRQKQRTHKRGNVFFPAA